MVTWATFTHTLERESRLNYSVLLNNGDGSMSIDNNAFTSNSVHYNHFAYRTIVEDFNNDGYDDIVSASMGVIQRLPGQDPYTRWEKIPLLFNTGDGQFYDASTILKVKKMELVPDVLLVMRLQLEMLMVMVILIFLLVKFYLLMMVLEIFLIKTC